NVRGITKSGWGTLQKLLPQQCSLRSSEMRVQNGPTLILLRNGTLSASEIEAGRFSAGELMIASPWLRQTFSQLRGASRWDANRLTLAGQSANPASTTLHQAENQSADLKRPGVVSRKIIRLAEPGFSRRHFRDNQQSRRFHHAIWREIRRFRRETYHRRGVKHSGTTTRRKPHG